MESLEDEKSKLFFETQTTCCMFQHHQVIITSKAPVFQPKLSFLFSLSLIMVSLSLSSYALPAALVPGGNAINQPVALSTRQQSIPVPHNLLNNNNNNKELINRQQVHFSSVPNILQPPITSLNQQNQMQQQQQQQQQNLYLNSYTKTTHDILLKLRQEMLKKSFKFNEHFKHLLHSSKIKLHNIFTDTYGDIYERNTEMFIAMFGDLEQYYATGTVGLTQKLESFFKKLYQKIFQVLNRSLEFTPEYLECATARLETLKPLKDTPERLIKGIKHTFVAARSFYQALSNGIDIIKSVITLVPSNQCTHLITDKLLFASVTQLPGSSATARTPCPKFCEEVIGRCIGKSYLDDLHTYWRGYVSSLVDLAKKLSTSYNMETIISPLDVQISEAIMDFQENGGNYSAFVFKFCGQPERPTLKPTFKAHPKNFHSGSRIKRSSVIEQPDEGREFSSSAPTTILINEIKDYMLSTKLLWQQLPKSVCSTNQSISSLNGNQANSYSLQLNATQSNSSPSNFKSSNNNCFQEPFGLSDINSDMRYRIEMQQQINRLASVRSKMESALAGNEVNWLNEVNSVSATSASSITTPASYTSTDETAEPTTDDEVNSEEDYPDEGSGEEPLPEEVTDETTEDPDYPTTTDTTTPYEGAITEPGQELDQVNSVNEINPFITPPDQAGAQRSSSETSNNRQVIPTLLALMLLTRFIWLKMCLL